MDIARHSGTQITEHIAQCEAFLGVCWEGEHEAHISHYEHKETELAKQPTT